MAQAYKRSIFVPSFIVRNYREGTRSGLIDGSVLISDIVGFTRMTESFFKLKKKGAEQLSDMLSGMFSRMIHEVYAQSGFIAGFAGDSFTSVFPGDCGTRAYRAACRIREVVRGVHEVDRQGGMTSIRSGIDSGSITWDIFGSGPCAYLFSGCVIRNAAAAERDAGPGEIITGEGVIPASISREATHEVAGSEGHRLGNDAGGEEMFVDNDYVTKSHTPEFRDVASVFTGFRSIEDMDEFIDTIMSSARDYGGYFNLLDCGDKGNLVLTLFGAPLTQEGNISRSTGFAQFLRSRYGRRVRSGITYGRVFSGFIGAEGVRGHYTVIGDKVNLASRLMESCRDGEIRVSAEMGRKLKDRFRTDHLRGLAIKGSKEAVSCVRILGSKAFSSRPEFEGSFIGRKRESGQVSDFAARTLEEDRTGVILIKGDAGIGKTRFAINLQNALNDTRMIYLKCDEILSKSLNPVESFFEDIFGTSGSEDPEESGILFESSFSRLIENCGTMGQGSFHAQGLMRLKPIIKGFMGISYEEEYTELDARSRFDNTILAFMHLVRLLAQGRRPFVIVDDIQWVDSDTRSILADLFDQMDFERPLLCLLTRPSGEQDPAGLFPASSEILKIDLNALEACEQTDLMSNFLPADPSVELRELIEKKAEGNPFYMEQIVMYLMDNEMLDISNDTVDLKSPDVQLPGSIMDIIVSRVDRLEEEIRKTVRYASVLGRRFNVRVLSRMLSGRGYGDHLVAGIEAGIWSMITEIQYIFRHALIRDAIYEMQMGGRLEKLHLLAGEIIEEIYGDDERMFSDLSYHFEKSHRMDKMLDYTLKAARYASANYWNREAMQMYEKYGKYEPDIHRKRKNLLNLGEIYQMTGDWQRSLDLYEETRRYSEIQDNRDMYAYATNRIGFLKHRMGMNDEALECFASAEREYESLGSAFGLATVRNNTGTVYIDRNLPEEAMSCFNSAIELLEERSDESGCAETMMFSYNNLGLVNQRLGELDRASECYRRSMDIAERIHSKRNLAPLNFGNILYLQDRIDEAEKYYEKARENAEVIGDRLTLRVLLNNLAAISTARGEFREALAKYREGLRIARSMNDKKGIRLLSQNIGEIEFYMGHYDQSEEAFEEAVRMASQLDDKRALGSSVGKKGIMHLYREEHDKARECLMGGIRHSMEAGDRWNVFSCTYHLGRTYAECGMSGRLEEVLGMLESMPEEEAYPEYGWYAPVLSLFSSELGGRIEEARRTAESIIEDHPGSEGEAIARVSLFRISGNRSERDRAVEIYESLYSESPMAFYRDTIDALETEGQ